MPPPAQGIPPPAQNTKARTQFHAKIARDAKAATRPRTRRQEDIFSQSTRIGRRSQRDGLEYFHRNRHQPSFLRSIPGGVLCSISGFTR